MMSYKDISFCSKKDCEIMECFRNQKNIDKSKFEKEGLLLSIGDFYFYCKLLKDLQKRK